MTPSVKECRDYALDFARDVVDTVDTTDDHMDLARAILWYEKMLDRARRVCTAAKAHVEWSKQWAASTGGTLVKLAPTMCELQESVAELVKREQEESK